ncbi:MAG: hypothetical protein RJA44_70 [Pseudomonadota bacterium]
MSRHSALLAAALAVLLTGCAATAPTCPSGQQPRVNELLYFGTAKPGGVVSQQEWSGFLADVVTPRFPRGLSVWPAAGQWLSNDGALVRESSYVLNIVHADEAAAETALQTIAAEYRSRFQQEAVMRLRSQVCVSF